MEYVPTIGLEIHAELKTKTKMFCRSTNEPFAAEPNTNICPVCLAHPGTLPVINREAVRHVLRVGVALGGQMADYTEFDRKNYFYPDLPKGYQISQYEYPLVSGGELAGVAITRVHLEEDTASSQHIESLPRNYADGTRTVAEDILRDSAPGLRESATLVDYNRAGVPLMELVTEPVITSARQAGDFARELQLLLRYLGASDANMEKGEMRVEANVSVAPASETFASADIRGTNAEGRGKILRDYASSLRNSAVPLGTKVEIKNLNSFRIMEKAVEYEIARQQKLLEKGEKVVQETRGWDDAKQSTFAQRTKEGSADYRYFPDPDLPSLHLSELEEFSDAALRGTLPVLPASRRQCYLDLGVKKDDADMFVRQPGYGLLFDTVIGGWESADPRVLLSANLIANNIAGLRADRQGGRDMENRDTEFSAEMPMSAENLKSLVTMLSDKKVTSKAGKVILEATLLSGKAPGEIARENDLYKVDDDKGLDTIVTSVISEHAKVVADYRAGKVAAMQFLVGQAMKASRGSLEAGTLRSALEKKISG